MSDTTTIDKAELQILFNQAAIMVALFSIVSNKETEKLLEDRIKITASFIEQYSKD